LIILIDMYMPCLIPCNLTRIFVEGSGHLPSPGEWLQQDVIEQPAGLGWPGAGFSRALFLLHITDEWLFPILVSLSGLLATGSAPVCAIFH